MFEYKFVAAPRQKISVGRMANADIAMAGSLDGEVNLIAQGGWEYLRRDSFPFRERRFLFFEVTRYRDVLVFRREMAGERPARPGPQPPRAPGQPIRPRRVRARREAGARAEAPVDVRQRDRVQERVELRIAK
ncbi:hypothetical protein [Albidovulum sp.]